MHALLIQIREVTAPPPDEEGVTEPVSVYVTEKGKGKGKGRDDVGEKWRNQRVTAPGGHGIIIQLSCCLMSRVLLCWLSCAPTGDGLGLRVTAPDGQVKLY